MSRTFAEVYAAEVAFVWRSLRRLGVQERDVEDACQETFLVAHRRFETFLGGSVRAWLFAIARRVASDHRKRAHVRREVLEPELLERGAPEEQTRALDERRARTLLDEILDTLDEDKRSVFVLFELEGCPMAEVAQVLECPVQTAYARLYAARETIERAIARVHSKGFEHAMNDPQRLSDASSGASDLLRAALAAARADSPSPADVARLSGSLSRALPAGALAGTSGAGALAGAKGTGGLAVATRASPVTWAVGAAVAASVAAGGIYAATRPSPPVPVPIATVRLGSTGTPPEAPTPELPAAPPLPAGTLPAAPMPSMHSTPAVHAPPEAQLLDRADQALRQGDAGGALALATEHAKAYPHGALAQERELIAIQALVALGRTEAASSRARAFRQAYPGSSHLTRLDALVGAP